MNAAEASLEWAVRITYMHWPPRPEIIMVPSREAAERFIAHPPLKFVFASAYDAIEVVSRTPAGEWTTATPEPAVRYLTQDEIDALPIGSVVMTTTDPEHFGLYEQRVWQKFGGAREWQFGQPRHEWQSTDGGFVRVGAQQITGFALSRRVVLLFEPDEATSSAIVNARRDFLFAEQQRARS
jgi:hypothetical protein